MVHVKKRKIEIRSVHRFGLTDLNKTMGKMCGRKNSKSCKADKICYSHLFRNILIIVSGVSFWPSIECFLIFI